MTNVVAAESETGGSGHAETPSQAPAPLAQVAAPAARLIHTITMIACIALIMLPILSDDTVREFPTVLHRLGYVLFENWWKFFYPAADHAVGWLRFNTIDALLVLGVLGGNWLDVGSVEKQDLPAPKRPRLKIPCLAK